jgi:glycosidase
MNYRWYDPTRSFFDSTPPYLTASHYKAKLDSLNLGIGPEHQRAMMNLTASHDTPRFSTSIYNRNRYKYKNTPRENPEYRIDRPDERTRQIQRMILVQQFTYIGAPHIWNGDEVGMWGADDPDDRKPMIWSDLRYEDETAHPLGRSRRHDRVVSDTSLFHVYRDLIELRKRHLRLFVDGSLHWLATDDRRRILVYDRVLGNDRAVVGFNASDVQQQIPLEADGDYRLVYPDVGDPSATARHRVTLPPRSASVWIRQ